MGATLSHLVLLLGLWLALVPPVMAQETATSPEDVILLQEAERETAQGNQSSALQRLKKLIVQYPGSPLVVEAETKAGKLLLDQDQPQEAEILLNHAANKKSDPFSLHALLYLGDINRGKGAIHLAVAQWLEIARENPPLGRDAHGRLSDLLSNPPSGNDPAAILNQEALAFPSEHLKAIIEQMPVGSALKPALLVALGDRLAREGREEEARQAWSQAEKRGGPMAGDAQARLFSPSSQEVFKAGLLLPMSGQNAVLGRNLLQAAQKALSDNRHFPLSLSVRDSGNDPARTATAIDELAAEGVSILIGPVFREEVQGAVEAASARNLPLMALNPRSELVRERPGVFLNALQPEQQARILARYAVKDKGILRVAILAPDNEYGRLTASVFGQEVVAQGGVLVREIYFMDNTRDYTPWIKSLMADLGDAGFGALFLPVRADQARLITPQLAMNGLRSQTHLLLGTSLWGRPELLQEGPDFLRDAVFCDLRQEQLASFQSSFAGAWGEEPSTLAFLVYDSVSALIQILSKGGGNENWLSLLSGGMSFSGVGGMFRFLTNGTSEREYQFYTVGEKGFQWLGEAK